MEISEHTLVRLVEGQAANTQALVDLKDSLDKSIPLLVEADEKNATNIRKVERKIWYFGGAGSMLGFIGTHFVDKWFGGK